MPDLNSPCAPLVACEGLDGSVLIRRTVYGPPLIDDSRPVAFGDFSLIGGVIRPYLDLHYETRWISKGLCRGPVSSVMSLAPTESITAGVRTARRDSFTQTMTDAVESSSVHTRTRHQLTDTTRLVPSGGGIGGVVGGIAGAVAGAAGTVAGDVFGVAKDVAGAVIDLGPVFAGLLGSIFEDIGSVVGAVVGGPIGGIVGSAAGNAIGGLIDGAVGGGGGGGAGPILTDTQHRIDEITDSIEKRESQSHVRQVVVSSTTEREEFLTRTFSNPYRDRSLQLRFLPVFRHFEVVTTIRFGIHGLSMLAGKLDAGIQRSQFAAASRFNLRSDIAVAGAAANLTRLESAATITRAALASAQVNHDDEDVRRPMAELLIRNADPADREKGVRIEQGLKWSAAQVRDNVLHVPAAEPAILAKAWRLTERPASRLSEAIARLSPDKLPALAPKIQTRQVHLFAGTHVEAVPGECTLPDIVTDALGSTDTDQP